MKKYITILLVGLMSLLPISTYAQNRVIQYPDPAVINKLDHTVWESEDMSSQNIDWYINQYWFKVIKLRIEFKNTTTPYVGPNINITNSGASASYRPNFVLYLTVYEQRSGQIVTLRYNPKGGFMDAYYRNIHHLQDNDKYAVTLNSLNTFLNYKGGWPSRGDRFGIGFRINSSNWNQGTVTLRPDYITGGFSPNVIIKRVQ